MKRSIYTKEWLKLHPYKIADSTDNYYTDLANRIFQALQNTPLGLRLDAEVKETMSLCISAWFEDVISGTGMWQVFTAECERRYGSKLPFYHLGDDYYPDEINVEDVRFLVWHYLQQTRPDDVLNPEDPNIEMAANSVYGLLDKEYEHAPENRRMQEFLAEGARLGKNDFYRYREMLEWFHYNSYLTMGNADILLDECEKMMEEDNLEYYGDHPEIALYATRIEQMLKIHNNLLGWTSPTWLEHIFRASAPEPADDAPWAVVKSTQQSCFLYAGEDEKFMYVKDLCETDDDYRIVKDSLNMPSISGQLEKGKTILSCMLVRYGGDWWQSGMLIPIPDNERGKDFLEIRREDLRNENDREAFRRFMKASGGKFIVFCKGKEGLANFYTQKMGLNVSPGFKFPEQISDVECVALSAMPKSGLCIQTEFVDCIKSPDNPSYNRQAAEESGIALICNPDVVCYELSCIMQDKGMTDDATLSSLASKEESRLFVRNNARFLTDYFFRYNREEAFDDPDLKEWLFGSPA